MRTQPHDTTDERARICNTRAPMSDAIALRNRFAMVKGAWDEHLRGVPFPALGEGTAEEKIERLEIALVDEMRNRATPETAEQAADAMWTLVHAPRRRGPGEDPRHAAPRGARAPRPPADLDSAYGHPATRRPL